MKTESPRTKHFPVNTHDFLRDLISKAEFTRESEDTKSIIHFLPSSLVIALRVMMKLSPWEVEFITAQIYPKTFQKCLQLKSRCLTVKVIEYDDGMLHV
jgi:hypothetical protein